MCHLHETGRTDRTDHGKRPELLCDLRVHTSVSCWLRRTGDRPAPIQSQVGVACPRRSLCETRFGKARSRIRVRAGSCSSTFSRPGGTVAPQCVLYRERSTVSMTKEVKMVLSILRELLDHGRRSTCKQKLLRKL